MMPVRARVAMASLLTAVAISACAPSASADRFANKPVKSGTWYTSAPLDVAIRRELPSSGRGEDPGMFRVLHADYKAELLRRNPGLAEIEEKRARGEQVPSSVPVQYFEMDYSPGFGN